MYVSQFSSNEIIVDDDNFHRFAEDPVVGGEQMSRGMEEWRLAWGSYASVPQSLMIPRSEWDERIEEMERTRSRISDMTDAVGNLPVLNQNGTNYCWINGVVRCFELTRMVQGEPTVRLSPASAGGPIKNYRNVGGWGDEGLDYIVKHGVVPVDLWPPNAIDRKYDTEESRKKRKEFMVPEWTELRPRNEDELISLLLNRIPVAVGFNWWRHLVCAVDPVALGRGQYGTRIDNSWGPQWGENGRGILKGTRHLPDGAVCIRSVTPGE